MARADAAVLEDLQRRQARPVPSGAGGQFDLRRENRPGAAERRSKLRFALGETARRRDDEEQGTRRGEGEQRRGDTPRHHPPRGTPRARFRPSALDHGDSSARRPSQRVRAPYSGGARAPILSQAQRASAKLRALTRRPCLYSPSARGREDREMPGAFQNDGGRRTARSVVAGRGAGSPARRSGGLLHRAVLFVRYAPTSSLRRGQSRLVHDAAVADRVLRDQLLARSPRSSNAAAVEPRAGTARQGRFVASA